VLETDRNLCLDENVPKIYFNLQNVYGETLVFVLRRIVCNVAKMLTVTAFIITR
jgi:hypothetical protein